MMAIVPARRGLQWVATGFALFGRQPLRWTLVAICYWVVLSLVGAVPYLGLPAATALAPVFSMSFMIMCRDVAEGRPLELPRLFAGFRTRPAALAALGAGYLVALGIVLALTQILDGGALMRWMLFRQPPSRAAGAEVVNAAIAALVLFLPVALAFWFAPPLVAWRALPPAKALFFSFFAALRNAAAFLVYLGALAALSLVVRAVFALLAAGFAGPGASLAALALVILIVPPVYASLYASYCDVFPDRGEASAHVADT